MSDGAYGLGGPGRLTALPQRVPPRGGRVLAEFTCARDARSFAEVKRLEGYDVTIMPSTLPQYLLCVRLLEPAL